MLKTLKAFVPERSPIRLLWHKAKALLAALVYRFPARKLTVIGITGTDGKTTTVGMLTHILHTNGVAVGSASTAYMQIRDTVIPKDSHLTSMSPFALQAFLRRLVREKCTHAVIEMSSHGLVQGRLDYTFPSICGITNLTSESLDYHKTMEQYRNDKGKVFTMLRGKGTKVLHAADTTYSYYSSIPSSKELCFGTRESDFFVEDVVASATHTSATLHAAGKTYSLDLPIPGVFNVQNAQCAIACASACGNTVGSAVESLSTFAGVPGRMERIDEGQNFALYVDFTVTLASYESTLKALRSIVGDNGRVLVLCSSCGNRMEEKRPLIGKVCSELADVVVVTEDETYGEDPHKVQEEVWAGVDQSACEAHKIFDRREAITFLFEHACKGDAVILCGMGPFATFQKLDGLIDWDERKVAREVLKRIENRE